MAPSSNEIPTMPLQVSMTAEKTVSRARVLASGPPLIISVTISATSMTVTATASTSDPNGSPTRCATTSAWWTAASTDAASSTATTTIQAAPMCLPQVKGNGSNARIGAQTVQWSSAARSRIGFTRAIIREADDFAGTEKRTRGNDDQSREELQQGNSADEIEVVVLALLERVRVGVVEAENAL